MADLPCADTLRETDMRNLASIGAVMAYIERHREMLGYPPSAVGLSYASRVKVLKEMGASDFAARCTNVTARVLDVPLVEVP